MARSGSRLDDRTMETLASAVEGDVMFDAFSRGRYATDASVYQVMPLAVVIPKSFATVFNITSGSRLRATRITSSRNPRG